MSLPTTIGGVRIVNEVSSLVWVAGMAIDADGSPRAYHPANRGLDDLGNAGHPGNWWGIVTHDGKPTGNPVIQGPTDPAPGFYVSSTSYMHPGVDRRNPRAYLDSELIPFIVVPPKIRNGVAGVVLGCKALVTNLRTGDTCWAVVGDIGPQGKLGEGSIALANALGVKSDPRRGGTDAPVIQYRIWPGIAADGYRLIPAK